MRVLLILLLVLPLPAAAFEAVTSREDFVALVVGKRLTGDGVGLRVTPDGAITGRGFGFKVTGTWQWQDGLFCRTLTSAIRDFPLNCQTVAVQGDVIRFRGLVIVEIIRAQRKPKRDVRGPCMGTGQHRERTLPPQLCNRSPGLARGQRIGPPVQLNRDDRFGTDACGIG